jgi:hypothetical protein
VRLGEFLPLLHTVETGQRGDGDKDDNCLLAVANFDLVQDPRLAGELQDTHKHSDGDML